MSIVLIAFAPVVFLAARCAWLNQDRLLGVTRSGFSWLAGRVGVATDVVVTSVLVESPAVLLGFRPSRNPVTPRLGPGLEPSLAPELDPGLDPGLEQILLTPDSDAQATIARLRRWEASGATVVMWRDRIAGSVELTHLLTGQQVTLSVIPAVVRA